MSGDQRGYRLTSIDAVRGLIIVVMALDHVRDFTMLAGTQDPMRDPHVGPALFVTRWITHLCAPVFVFLAGTSAGLMTARKTRRQLASFLFTRGVWIVFIEVTVLSFAFTFAPFGGPQSGGRTVIILQTLYAIGGSMIVLAAAQLLGRRACLLLGLLVVVGHNALDSVWPTRATLGPEPPLWVSLHTGMVRTTEHFRIVFGYPLLPWVGVMLTGFGAAALFEKPPADRDRLLQRLGLGCIAAFVLLRVVNVYGDPRDWHVHDPGLAATVMSFFNANKYPPSLDYLLMTLGPAAILCASADRFHGAWKDTLVMYGRVPFAFYLAHFYLAHSLAVLLGVAEGFSWHQMVSLSTPDGFGVRLPGVYAIWVVVVVMLYPFCRWMARVKARRKDWWLSYL
jgi:uncharacterized membrane protein